MAKLLPPARVDTTALTTEAEFTPQLLIPSEAIYSRVNGHHFPDYPSILYRAGVDKVQIIEEFAKAIRIAQRVWIIDRHLFSEDGENPIHWPRIQKVVNLFLTSQVQSVRILTGYHADMAKIKDEFDGLVDFLLNERGSVGPSLKIDVKFDAPSFNHIHDRFAIIDGELWHFGATVGGFHRPVNAASRGWNAEAHSAVQFFEAAWKIATDRVRS